LKKAVNTVAPVVTAALPIAATALGTVVGGPLGAKAGNMIGNLASGAISSATGTQPNRFISNIGQAASSIATGNIQGAIPGLVNVSRDVGNAIHRGAGDRIANVASNVAGAATAIAGGNYRGAIPNVINASREVGNAIQPGMGNQVANVASGIAGAIGAATGRQQLQGPQQLLSFIRSTPLLQSLLATVATGNLGTALQIPQESEGVTTTNYVEMLESLKYLTEQAIAEADNAGFSTALSIESEAVQDSYIESVIESVSNYENSRLPNYDVIAY
jgi:hypothetical protein